MADDLKPRILIEVEPAQIQRLLARPSHRFSSRDARDGVPCWVSFDLTDFSVGPDAGTQLNRVLDEELAVAPGEASP